jgi:hypothetical protein
MLTVVTDSPALQSAHQFSVLTDSQCSPIRIVQCSFAVLTDQCSLLQLIHSADRLSVLTDSQCSLQYSESPLAPAYRSSALQRVLIMRVGAAPSMAGLEHGTTGSEESAHDHCVAAAGVLRYSAFASDEEAIGGAGERHAGRQGGRMAMGSDGGSSAEPAACVSEIMRGAMADRRLGASAVRVLDGNRHAIDARQIGVRSRSLLSQTRASSMLLYSGPDR